MKEEYNSALSRELAIMYNGIGLATVRGSATSGHVQKNMSYLRPEFFRNKLDVNQSNGRYGDARKGKDGANYKVNKDVIEHNRKHAVEAKVYEYEDSLREDGTLSEEQIESKVNEFRQRLQNQGVNSGRGDSVGKGFGRGTDTHEISARKNAENERLRSAFGISANFVSGSSFDPAAQEARRKEREAERAARAEQNRVDRLRREEEREQRLQARAKREAEGGPTDREEGARNQRAPRERYVPKERTEEEMRNRNRSRSRDRSRDRRGPARVDSRERSGNGGGRKRGRSSSRSGSQERESRRSAPAQIRRSPSRSRSADRSPAPEARRSPERDRGRGRGQSRSGDSSRSSSRSSGSSRRSSSSGSYSSRSSRSGSSRSESSGRRSRSSSSRHSRTPQPTALEEDREKEGTGAAKDAQGSPPRRKTRWGDK